MRGEDIFQESLFTQVQLESFVPKDHPLRPVRQFFDEALKKLNWLFDTIYSEGGRESIPPERLLRAQLLQVLYSIRSERQLVEQLQYNLLYRWFVGLTIDDTVWHHSSFSTNRDRLLDHEVIPLLFEEVVTLARKQHLLSDDHFSVDGTLIQAWASHKSFQPKEGPPDDSRGSGRNAQVHFQGKKRRNDTHESKTDSDARLARKGKQQEAKLAYMGHSLIENRHGFVVGAAASRATGKAEREVAEDLLCALPGDKRRTVAADKNYDELCFVASCRAINVTPHVAQNTSHQGGSAIDGRTTRHASYGMSQRCRKRVEEPFGWGKTVGLIRQFKVRGLDKVNTVFLMTMMGWNLTRLRNLQESCV